MKDRGRVQEYSQHAKGHLAENRSFEIIEPIAFTRPVTGLRVPIYLNSVGPISLDSPDPHDIRRFIARRIRAYGSERSEVFSRSSSFEGIAIAKSGIAEIDVSSWEDIDVFISRETHGQIIRALEEKEGSKRISTTSRSHFGAEVVVDKRNGKTLLIVMLRGAGASVIPGHKIPSSEEEEAILRATKASYYYYSPVNDREETIKANPFLEE